MNWKIIFIFISLIISNQRLEAQCKKSEYGLITDIAFFSEDSLIGTVVVKGDTTNSVCYCGKNSFVIYEPCCGISFKIYNLELPLDSIFFFDGLSTFYSIRLKIGDTTSSKYRIFPVNAPGGFFVYTRKNLYVPDVNEVYLYRAVPPDKIYYGIDTNRKIKTMLKDCKKRRKKAQQKR